MVKCFVLQADVDIFNQRLQVSLCCFDGGSHRFRRNETTIVNRGGHSSNQRSPYHSARREHSEAFCCLPLSVKNWALRFSQRQPVKYSALLLAIDLIGGAMEQKPLIQRTS